MMSCNFQSLCGQPAIAPHAAILQSSRRRTHRTTGEGLTYTFDGGGWSVMDDRLAAGRDNRGQTGFIYVWTSYVWNTS